VGIDHLRNRGSNSGGSPGAGGPLSDPETAKAYPSLWEFLTAQQWGNGDRRDTGTLLVFVEGPVVKACVKDKDASAVAFVSARTLKELLQAVDKGLESGGLDWRADRPFKRGGK